MVKLEEELAMEILDHVIWAGLFYNRRAELALRLTLIGRSSARLHKRGPDGQLAPSERDHIQS
jgi:hypothetical protein